MTRVRLSLFASLDGRLSAGGDDDGPMGADWGRLTAAYVQTRTFRRRVLGLEDGSGTTGLDDAHAAASFEGVGAEIMGAGMFGLHAHPDAPDWRGWWGEEPPFGYPVLVLTHGPDREPIEFPDGTRFLFRSGDPRTLLAEAREAAGGRDVRIGGGTRTSRSFLEADLVDEVHVQVAPVLLGRGPRLWDGLERLEETHDLRTEAAESGTVHLTFTRRA